jgi:hypothetical protein
MATLGWLVSQIQSGQDLVLLRNSMIADVKPAGVYFWTPATVPYDYLVETRNPPHQVLQFARNETSRTVQGDDMEKAMRLAAALVRLRGKVREPIQSDTVTALRRITTEGAGYCADYTQVFNALAPAAGLSVREWGMAFDGYGGDGHAFSEVWDRKQQQWVFLDSFYSFYVTNAQGRPISALEFRRSLLDGTTRNLEIVPINPRKFGFKSSQKAIDYYKRGAPRFFLIWGNNVLSYDENPAVRMMSDVSRPAEQVAGIIAGVQPRMVIPEDLSDQAAVAELSLLRMLIGLMIVGGLVSTVSVLLLRAARR